MLQSAARVMASKRTLLASKVSFYIIFALLSIFQPEYAWLKEIGITENTAGVYNGTWHQGEGEEFTPISPFSGEPIASFRFASKSQYDATVKAAHEAYKEWRMVSMPNRGDVVKKIGRELEDKIDLLRQDQKNRTKVTTEFQ